MVVSGNVTFFPERAPDETLYSQCARFYSRSGFDTPDVAGQLLFEDSQAGNHAQLPFGLNHFTSFEFSSLSSLDLLRQQTISGIYLAFMNADEIANFLAIRSVPRPSALEGKHGLFGHKIFLNHPLKYCPDCVELDLQEHGFSYWHNSHQFPGVWICARHSSLLIERVRSPLERNSWLRPPSAPSNQPCYRRPLGKEALQLLIKLAEAMQWISEQHELSPVSLRKMLLHGQTCFDELHFHGFLTSALQCFHTDLKELEIEEIRALGALPHRWFSPHEPPVLHPVQWAAAIAYCIPSNSWDEALKSTYSTSPGALFEEAEPVPERTSDPDAQLNLSVLAMTLNISQTAPSLHASHQRNLFTLSASASSMELRGNSIKERKRRLYRAVVIQDLFSRTPKHSIQEGKEAMSWLLVHDSAWLTLVKTDIHKAMQQLPLFLSV